MPENRFWRRRTREVATARGLDADYFERLIGQESSFDDDIISGRVRSPVGALGIAQFMPATASDLGIDPLNPEQALQGAATYLLRLKDYFRGDWSKATAAYNAGPGNIDRAVASGGDGWRAFVPAETMLYLERIRPDAIGQAEPPASHSRFPNFWDFPVTQGFGPTDVVEDSPYLGHPHFNKGIDFGTPAGTPVLAVLGGAVSSVGDAGDGWGIRVWIQDADGNTHNYGHLREARVRLQQQVGSGELIGISGNSGRSTGPHLSYDVWDKDGNFFDPMPFLEPILSGGGATAPEPVPEVPRTYTVKPDDNLLGIAARFGLHWSVVYQANRQLISDPNVLQPGWQLTIPIAAAAIYVVKPGDTLSALAAQWGCDVAAIVAFNGIANPDVIEVGQRLRIPSR